jgi:lipoprotein-releasing system permease protein
VVLGGELARAMGVREGDTVTLIAPSGQVTPAGVVPRLKQMTVAGTFDSGHYEYDSALVMMHQDDAARKSSASKALPASASSLKDLHQAREVAFAVVKNA